LIVTKHQSQQKPPQQQSQSSHSQSLLVVDDVKSIAYQRHQSGDGSDGSECLSDSTIEQMRQQVRMQREKVEDER
jgi:hypothetical protein